MYLRDTTGEKFKRLKDPIMSRWWLVGECACSFKDSIKTWRKICQTIRNSAPRGSTSSKISSCTLNLIDSSLIINDFYLICVFCQSFFFPHFKFLQLADKHGSITPSFQARHLMVRYFLMMNDLRNIKEDWKRNAHFRDYLQSLSKLNTTDKVE